MKLNDPFGRLQQKQESSYEALRDTLRGKGVDSRRAADAVLRNILRNALLVTAVLCLVVLASALMFPGSVAMVAVLAALGLIWVLATTVNGRRLVQRYIEEELSD